MNDKYNKIEQVKCFGEMWFILILIGILMLIIIIPMSIGLERNCNKIDNIFNKNYLGYVLREGFKLTCNKENSIKEKTIDLKSECVNYILTK